MHAKKPSPDPQTFGESTLMGSVISVDEEPARRSSVRASMFDACQVGVVLRAVLFAEAMVGVTAMFDANNAVQWLLRFALLTGGVLPATLAWLIVARAQQHAGRPLQPGPEPVQP